MNNQLSNKYFVSTNGTQWEDVTSKWNGVKILSIDGFNEKGEAVNIYNEQWINSQQEDFLVAGNNVIRKNVDINITIIVSRRYANGVIDEQSVFDQVVDYMCDNGAIYVKSMYTDKIAKAACIKGFKPTTQKLHRGDKSYILATIPLHLLDKPTSVNS